MARPGDRRKRWNETCAIEGLIMTLFAIMLMSTGCLAGITIGIIVLFFGILYFKDIKTGWKMSNKRPPWADEHDAIDEKWHNPSEVKTGI